MVTKKDIDEVVESVIGGGAQSNTDAQMKARIMLDNPQMILEALNDKGGAMHQLRNHPLVMRHMRGSENPSGRITQAWQAEGERLVYMLLSGSTAPIVTLAPGATAAPAPTGTEEPLALNFGESKVDQARVRTMAYFALSMAVTYLWRPQILDMAEALPVPRHTIPENVMPYQHMYWTWEGPRPVIYEDPQSGYHLEFDGDGMLIWYGGDGVINTCMFGVDSAGLHIVPSPVIHIGSTWPDDYTEGQQSFVGPVLSKLAFLNSPYISTDRERLDRPTRHSLARASVRDVDPNIHVVKLRESSTPSGVGNSTEGKFHHQWWVRGHIRAQWYPSRKGHKLIWIQEHLKGPNDAPIIKKVYDVKR